MFGTVIFDDNSKISAGWASIDGEKAFRIRGIGDLRSDCLWWLSLDRNNFFKGGLTNHSHLRASDYLRSTMQSIIVEMGIGLQFIPVAQCASILSEVFSRVMALAKYQFDVANSTKQYLAEDIRLKILPDDVFVSDEMNSACETSYISYINCAREIDSSEQNKTTINFKCNRFEHMMDIVSTPVPSQQFSYHPRSKLPSQEHILRWADDSMQPLLLEVTLHSVAPQLANIVSFNSGAKRSRNWITHAEFVALNQFSKIEIHSAFIFSAYESLVAHSPPPLLPPGFGRMSISIGLICENYWVACSMPSIKRGVKSLRLYTPRIAWLRATDRNRCMVSAIRLSQMGQHVMSYGYGQVVCSEKKEDLAISIENAASLGLMPPIGVALNSGMVNV